MYDPELCINMYSNSEVAVYSVVVGGPLTGFDFDFTKFLTDRQRELRPEDQRYLIQMPCYLRWLNFRLMTKAEVINNC